MSTRSDRHFVSLHSYKKHGKIIGSCISIFRRPEVYWRRAAVVSVLLGIMQCAVSVLVLLRPFM
jgi:hypothetical protein